MRGIDTSETVSTDVVNLQSLQFSSSGQVLVPGQGVLEMTPWARQQLGSEIGVRWDKFFGNSSPDVIQSAVKNHLASRNTPVLRKVISRKHTNTRASSNGILRAFVGPTYSELPDVQILDRMEHSIGKTRLDEMGFYHVDMTDKGTFMSIVYKDAVDLLGGRDATDSAYYGLRIRNSEVGAFSLVGDGYLLKLVCTNGMLAGFSEDRWLYKRHRNLDEEVLDELLDGLFTRLQSGRDEIEGANRMLKGTIVDNPAEDIRGFMRRNHRPKAEQDAAVKALCEDIGIDVPADENDIGQRTAFDITQGIARLGMSLRKIPERQHEIEQLAGDYMRKVISNYTPAVA